MIESINEEEYNYVVMQMIIAPRSKLDDNESVDDISFVTKKVRDKLEKSPTIILPFIESCTRNADKIKPSQMFNSFSP